MNMNITNILAKMYNNNLFNVLYVTSHVITLTTYSRGQSLKEIRCYVKRRRQETVEPQDDEESFGTFFKCESFTK